MGAQRTSFGKLQRDRAKKAKAAAKRERRQGTAEPGLASDDRDAADAADAEVLHSDLPDELSAAELLERVEALHRQFDAKAISFEDFEEAKAELLARLPID